MGIGKASCCLDNDVKNSLLYLFLGTFIKRPILNAVLQAAVVHPFGKDRRHTADITHIVAGDDIWMQAEVDPVLALFDEFLFPPIAAFGKESWLWALHRQINIPALMMNTPHTAHATMDRLIQNGIGFKDLISFLYLFIGDGFRSSVLRIL